MSQFFFKHENWGDDFESIEAFDFDDAAIKFGRMYNEDGDYSLMNGEPVSVIISDGKIDKTYSVYAEPDIHYSAYFKSETERPTTNAKESGDE